MRSKTRNLMLAAAVAMALSGCGGPAPEAAAVTDIGHNACNSVIYETLTDLQKACYDQLLPGFLSFASEFTVVGEELDVEVAYGALTADRPEMFYVTGYVYNTRKPLFSDVKEVTIYPSYSCSASEYEAVMAPVEAAAKEWMENLSPNQQDYDKAQRLFEDITARNEYSKGAPYGQNIVSTFLYGKAVCGGYAQGYSYVMQRAGIPCATISGTLDGIPHMWALSVLEGSYYASDPTSGDASYVDDSGNKGSYVDYSYFNMDPELMVTRYVPDQLFSGFTFTARDDGYFIHGGTYFEGYSRDEFEEALGGAAAAGLNALHVQYANIDGLKAAARDLFQEKAIQDMMPYAQEINYVIDEKMNTLTIFIPGAESEEEGDEG